MIKTVLHLRDIVAAPSLPFPIAAYLSCTACICDRHSDILHLKYTGHCIRALTLTDGDNDAWQFNRCEKDNISQRGSASNV